MYRSERVASLVATPTADADGDGIFDELDNCPDDANAAQDDLDTNGLGNTCDLDDDGDVLLDVHETGTGIFVSETDTGTDPLLFDTDGDGVDDGTEVALGLDPNNPPAVPALPVFGLFLCGLGIGATSRRWLAG